MLWNSFLLALREIRRNLLRSFLTIIGIVIGVSAVVTMVTLGNGATQSIKNQVASLGSNLLQIYPKFVPNQNSNLKPFTMDDIEAIRTQVTGLSGVAPQSQQNEPVMMGTNRQSTNIIGTNNDYFTVGNWQLASGRLFTSEEERSGQKVCILGANTTDKLFGKLNSPLGNKIRIDKLSCQVVGVLQFKGGGFGYDRDSIVIMPIITMQRRLTGELSISDIQVSVAQENQITQVKKQITALLRERRQLGSEKKDDFDIFDARATAEALSNTTKVLTALLGAIASVSLLVGGIGIMNIMLVSVTERTREIGIRLAIGALEREVLLQFLIESVVLAALGGLVGIILAAIASILIAQLTQIPYQFDIQINLFSFLFSAAIGILFGYMPAKRAARLDPIEALRHE